MKFYQEITVMPNHEVGNYFIWSKLLTQIHLGLVSIQDNQEKSSIGISFPEYSQGKKFNTLGTKLRLFTQSEEELKKFDSIKWLSRLTDYVHVTSVRDVPKKINGYAIYSRHQPKVNKERLARRYAKRHNTTYDLALEHYKDMDTKMVKYPFIKLKSLSSKNDFCLWIKKTATSELNYQKFSTYGLSEYSKNDLNQFSAVPEF